MLPRVAPGQLGIELQRFVAVLLYRGFYHRGSTAPLYVWHRGGVHVEMRKLFSLNRKTVSTQPSTEKKHTHRNPQRTDIQNAGMVLLATYSVSAPTVYGTARNLPIYRIPVPMWYCSATEDTGKNERETRQTRKLEGKCTPCVPSRRPNFAFYPAGHYSLHVTALRQPSSYLLVWSLTQQEHGFSTDVDYGIRNYRCFTARTSR